MLLTTTNLIFGHIHKIRSYSFGQVNIPQEIEKTLHIWVFKSVDKFDLEMESLLLNQSCFFSIEKCFNIIWNCFQSIWWLFCWKTVKGRRPICFWVFVIKMQKLKHVHTGRMLIIISLNVFNGLDHQVLLLQKYLLYQTFLLV